MRGDIVVTLRMCHLQTPNRPTVRALCSQLHGCMCGVVALLTGCPKPMTEHDKARRRGLFSETQDSSAED